MTQDHNQSKTKNASSKVRGIKNLEKLVSKFVNVKKDIAEASNNKDKLTYISRFMCFAALPQSDTGETVFTKNVSFGNIDVRVRIVSEYGVPYGMWARRLLAYLCHQALRNQDPTIYLGKTQSDFLRKIHPKDLFASGGKRGTIKAIKEQSKRLFSAALFIEANDKKQWSFKNSVFVERGSISWTENYRAPWEGSVTLSQAMYEDIKQHAVPVEVEILNKFSSTLAFDVYLWLRWKTHHMRKDAHITWDQLFSQFGHGYQNNLRGKLDFKKEIKKHLVFLSGQFSSIKIQTTKKTISLYKKITSEK